MDSLNAPLSESNINVLLGVMDTTVKSLMVQRVAELGITWKEHVKTCVMGSVTCVVCLSHSCPSMCGFSVRLVFVPTDSHTAC